MESTLSEVPQISSKEFNIELMAVGVLCGAIAFTIWALVNQIADLKQRNRVLSDSAREMFEASMRDKKPANENEPSPV